MTLKTDETSSAIGPGFDTMVFAFIVAGVRLILRPVWWLLQIVYAPCKFLVLPMMLLLFAFSLVWFICAALLSAVATLARSSRGKRILAFFLALPLVVVASILFALAPLPSPASYSDLEEKMHLILGYPNVRLFGP